MSLICNHSNIRLDVMMFVKQPAKSKSNPLGLKGENMRIFFKQKLTKKVMEAAVKTGHIIFAP